MDGLFNHLDSKCNVENLLTDIHTLIHADDTDPFKHERGQLYT